MAMMSEVTLWTVLLQSGWLWWVIPRHLMMLFHLVSTRHLCYCVVDTVTERAAESGSEAQAALCVEEFPYWERDAATEASSGGFPAYRITGSVTGRSVIGARGPQARHDPRVGIRPAPDISRLPAASRPSSQLLSILSTWRGEICYAAAQVKRIGLIMICFKCGQYINLLITAMK
jgi:hypothetical protein